MIKKKQELEAAPVDDLPPPVKPPALINKAEVLRRVPLSFATIWMWMRVGKFPCSRDIGGKVLWLESEVDAWVSGLPLMKYKEFNQQEEDDKKANKPPDNLKALNNERKLKEKMEQGK